MSRAGGGEVKANHSNTLDRVFVVKIVLGFWGIVVLDVKRIDVVGISMR